MLVYLTASVWDSPIGDFSHAFTELIAYILKGPISELSTGSMWNGTTRNHFCLLCYPPAELRSRGIRGLHCTHKHLVHQRNYYCAVWWAVTLHPWATVCATLWWIAHHPVGLQFSHAGVVRLQHQTFEFLYIVAAVPASSMRTAYVFFSHHAINHLA